MIKFLERDDREKISQLQPKQMSSINALRSNVYQNNTGGQPDFHLNQSAEISQSFSNSDGRLHEERKNGVDG